MAGIAITFSDYVDRLDAKTYVDLIDLRDAEAERLNRLMKAKGDPKRAEHGAMELEAIDQTG